MILKYVAAKILNDQNGSEHFNLGFNDATNTLSETFNVVWGPNLWDVEVRFPVFLCFLFANT